MARKEQPAKNRLFKWVYDPRCEKGTGTLLNVGIYADGTLCNPHGYPEDVVREAVAAAVEQVHAWRSKNAKKAAETRALRRKYRINQIAEQIIAGRFKPSDHCAVCKRALTNTESVIKGVGPECTEALKKVLEELTREKEAAPKAPPAPVPPLRKWWAEQSDETRAEMLRRREAGEDGVALFKEYGAPIAA